MYDHRFANLFFPLEQRLKKQAIPPVLEFIFTLSCHLLEILADDCDQCIE